MTDLSFGEWLKRHRMGNGLTREQLAHQIGCATVTLRKIESEERRPSEQIAERIADIFNIPKNERAAFLRFTRGDYTKAPPEQRAETPWQFTETRNNLHTPFSSLIGRKTDISTVREYLNTLDTRLVTLFGPPGIGKTHLSIAIARESLADFRDGVFFVELAPLEDSSLVALTIAQTLGFAEAPDKTIIQRIIEGVANKTILVVLDNIEHMIDVIAPLVSNLLSACPRLKILTTSREPIRCPGEWLYPVPVLTFPTEAEIQTIRPDEYFEFAAVKLFHERARAVKPDFTLTSENIQTVTAICARLDGLPLAIELLAARVRLMSPQYLLAQMTNDFILSTDGIRAVSARQKTLQNAIEWSYRLLTDKEKILFRRLSIFSGGWTMDAAKAVCADNLLPVDEIPHILANLMDKSLAAQQVQTKQHRYQFLTTVRNFASEKLTEAKETKTISQMHLDCYVNLAEQAGPELYHSDQVHWLNTLDAERDNLRSAMEYAITNNKGAGLKIAINSWQFWEPYGYSSELTNWLSKLLDTNDSLDGSLYTRAMVIYSQLIAQCGDLARARVIAERSLQLSRLIADKRIEAFSLEGLGIITALQGDLRHALPIMEQSLNLYKNLDDKLGQAKVKGWLWLNNSDPRQSKAHIEESLWLYRELGHLSGIALCLSELAHRTIWEGNFSLPSPWLDEAFTIYRNIGDQSGEAEVLYYHGNLFYWKGDYHQASEYYKKAIKLLEKVGIYLYSYWPKTDLAYTLLRQGRLSDAIEAFVLCMKEFRKANNNIGMVYTIEGVASVFAQKNLVKEALILFSWADHMRKGLNDRRPDVEQNSVEKDLQVIQSGISASKFKALQAKGRTLSMEQAIELVTSIQLFN